MQSSLQQQTTHRMHRHSPSLPTRTAAFSAAPAGRQAGGRHATSCGALSPISIVTTGLVLGAWYLSQQEAVEQERREASDGRPCPSCGGSGLQPCFCTKWSDGDVGCSSCSSSGWTKCKSCGGGGMAVPIKVSIRKNDMM